jgi:hypothetical protein
VQSATQWDAAKARQAVWAANNDYKLMVKDCASYTLDVARAASLRVPVRNRIFNTIPYQAIRMLEALNPEEPNNRKPLSVTVRNLH